MSPKAFVIITELLFILFMWLLQIQYIEPEVILRNVLGGAPADVMVVQHMMADLGPLLRNTGPHESYDVIYHTTIGMCQPVEILL